MKIETPLALSLAACAVLALTAGVAWAAMTQTQPVPQGHWIAEIELVPGVVANVRKPHPSDMPELEVDFSIDYGPDGDLVVNGESAFAFDPGATYRIEIEGITIAGIQYTDTRIYEGGALRFQQLGNPLDAPVDELEVTAEAIHHFTVDG